ncbi:SubName: Full=Uncharacterized protein {ECO:0000313/EMBL:CCA77965.1} [Serendipita indica DSM 11827]|nr:SubName: Full=Uncharacterized protein {ECO:0000313/EMBL:CCA77965.1} [Serendipita indica DSM 11827]
MSDAYGSPRNSQRTTRASFSSSPHSVTPLARAQWPWVQTASARNISCRSVVDCWTIATTNNATNSVVEDYSIRQWTFSAFEWTIPNVTELRRFVEEQNGVTPLRSDESQPGQPSEIPRILQETPLVGDGKFKLEVNRALTGDDNTSTTGTYPPPSDSGPSELLNISSSADTPPATLSICLTSLQLDYYPECELSTTIMVGVKANTNFSGQRGARTQFIWEAWEDFVFRRGSEFWECSLPALGKLLENPHIAASDAFTLSIQIHTPLGPYYPQQPSAYYVPKDLLDGVEASLDNANTGDVQFVCLERFIPDEGSQATSVEHRRDSSASSSGSPSFTARKRIIYAHSDILVRRSEYFATLISSSFRENAPGSAMLERERGKTMHTIVVEEADFVTVYWLLKYLYCDWLLFRERDDPRAAVDGIGAGWSARWLSQGNEWEWKTLSSKTRQFEDQIDREDDGTSKSVTSESATSIVSGVSQPSKGINALSPSSSARTPSRVSNSSHLRTSSSHGSTSAQRKPAKLVTSGVPVVPPPRSPSASARSSPPHGLYYSMSPSQTRAHSNRVMDPHPHPTPSPIAASALSIYQIAHRYGIPGLQQLALDHMMSTLSPPTSFPLLLATCFWTELHGMVQDYVVENWQAVSSSDEFESCCQEVATGEWGTEGGKTLASLFRRLHSPSSIRYAPS